MLGAIKINFYSLSKIKSCSRTKNRCDLKSERERALQTTLVQIHDVQLDYGRLKILLVSNTKNDNLPSHRTQNQRGVLSLSAWCFYLIYN